MNREACIAVGDTSWIGGGDITDGCTFGVDSANPNTFYACKGYLPISPDKAAEYCGDENKYPGNPMANPYSLVIRMH